VTAPPQPSRSPRETLAAVRRLAERASNLLGAPQALRDSARQQVDALASGEVAAQLRQRPVEELRPLVGKGTRLGSLEDAGFRTVGDIQRAEEYQLTRVQGVGPHTASEVVEAARGYASRIAKEVTVRLDPDRRTPPQTQLLATLAATREADAAASTLREPLQQFTERTNPLLPDAERTTSRRKMFFAGRGTKNTARSALAQLESLLADPQVTSLGHSLTAAERAADPSAYDAEALWRDYLTDAASFNALLSTLGGAGETDDVEAAQGYIGPELRQQISAVPLDTSLLHSTLRGYQVFGAQYAIHQEHSMVGDEMGLGKTIEALAVFAHLAAKGQRRFMVVCPASVQINWLNEIAKHTRLTAHSLHGRDREATGQHWLRRGGVAVTTFGTLPSLRCLDGADLAMLVVDEAHYAKNPGAKRSQAVQQAIERAQRILFLTGTPMENRVEEFRNLVGYLQPRLAARIDPSDALAGAKAFRRAVAPAYLRRNQEDVLTELPEKIEVEDWVQLSPDDDAAYREAVASRNMMRMRQAAFAAPNSAKLERLVEIVEEASQDGRKVIVYSYFLNVLDVVGRKLGKTAMGPLTGSVPPQARQRMIDDFNAREGPAVLCSQIEAGGVGLNVQAASVVIIAEPQWKPSTEEQALARAHRMGQVRTVQVHRLLAKGSVDDRMREILEHKQLLFDEFARKSNAKEADPRAVDREYQRPAVLDEESVPLERRVILAEQHRLGVL
jgi:superfamily II DNA or RNA helicase